MKFNGLTYVQAQACSSRMAAVLCLGAVLFSTDCTVSLTDTDTLTHVCQGGEVSPHALEMGRRSAGRVDLQQRVG